MGIKKIGSLKTAFWKFLILLLIFLAIAAILPFVIFLLFVNSGHVTYANYSEQSAKAIAPVLASTPDLSKVTLPAGCKFLLLDKEYRLLETSLEGDALEQALEYAISGKAQKNNKTQYLLVTREKEYIVLQYYIGSQFTNDWLNTHLPSPELLLYAVIVFNCIVICIFLTAVFSKLLRRQLSPLFEATKEVAAQNLDFMVGYSNIKEFNDILFSFGEMKNNLKASLEQQWNAEQLQKEQIAALAHDLKTPLTVIQGNVDLMNETCLDEEQQLYANFIAESSEQMKLYIQALIELSKTATAYQLHIIKENFLSFWNHIESQAGMLCKAKRIKFIIKNNIVLEIIYCDRILLERAVMNIISNAVDFSNENGTLYVDLQNTDGYLEIIVTDEGCGFSLEAQKHATERFFMGEKSRSSKMHYGMGLSIANWIITQHNGQLILENSKETHGAKVTFRIPLTFP